MFLYWDGYEIDGSDTDFDIILPENVQVAEFVECYLSVPLFTNTTQPDYDYNNKQMTKDELISTLLAGDYKSPIYITINCQHPDLLTNELRDEIYAKTEKRKIYEDQGDSDDYPIFPKLDCANIENPCTPPIIQNGFSRGGVTMSLSIYRDYEDENGVTRDIGLTLNAGPGAFFEYTIFIMDYMQERFPSIKIDLDSGFNTCSCSFAASLYKYEKIQLPIKHSIKHALKRLCVYGLMSLHSRYENGWKHKCITNGFLELPTQLVIGIKPLNTCHLVNILI